MGITAVVVLTTCGGAIGAVAGARAIRRGDASPGAVAFCGAGLIAVGLLMVLNRMFWFGLDAADPSQALMPDFFTPGRKEKILWWYAAIAAGFAALLAAAWGRLRGQRRQT